MGRSAEDQSQNVDDGCDTTKWIQRDMRRMATYLPRGEAWISETGSHFAMSDDQQNYFRALLSFPNSTERDFVKTKSQTYFDKCLRAMHI
jgi:hypothetical protein